jgi:protein-S-isoprenylcysteine O-methyltransferase Ste14
MNTTYFIFLGFYLATLVVRTIYELLKKAGRVDPGNKILFTIIFIDMCVMWVSWFAICPIDPLRLVLPETVRWIGLIMLGIGLVIAIGALIQLRGLEDIKHLVTTGLYSKFRHPIYYGFILWILGEVIYRGAIISLLAGLAGIGSILFWRRLEEENLEACFGDDYARYREKTWF